jgi:hypothetical protein
MNAKKSLENRIRGWFPKEPILREPTQRFQGIANDQILIRHQGGTRSTPVLGFGTLVTTFLGITILLSGAISHISTDSQIVWLSLGLISGVVLSVILAKKVLNSLATRGETSPSITLPKALLFVGALIILLGAVLWLASQFLPATIGSFPLDFLLGSLIGFGPARFVLFFAWERKNNKLIFTNPHARNYYAVTKTEKRQR